MLLSDLQLLIGKSAQLMNKLSHEKCQGSHVNTESCSWYHGAWQYLRACDKVSSPTWHLDFYIDSLCRLLKPNANVLISGTADYSTLSIVLFVANKLGMKLCIDVVDLCRTPLVICDWYADQVNAEIKTINKSIFDLDKEVFYDVIITDAFLTRFTPSSRSNLLVKWSKLLQHEGNIITTVRTNEVLSDNQVIIHQKQSEDYVKEVSEIYKGLNLQGDTANIEEIAKKYINNIQSFPYESNEIIYKEFTENGFKIAQCTENLVKGEAKPTKYLQILASKNHP